MCIITAEETEADRLHWLKVTKTNIFARHTRPGYQAIAYSLSIASKSAAAMILPLPVVADSGEDAVQFIDLGAYPGFFDNLQQACEPEYDLEMFDLDETLEMGRAEAAALLMVHEVGDYEASYVPTMRDFIRLDPRFRLPDEVWQKMPEYSDYGFAVFQLKLSLMQDEQEVENTLHPMAFEFPTRDPTRLFYPAVHVHDGDFHKDAGFYHRFYCQRENARSEFKFQQDLFNGRPPLPAREKNEGDVGFDGYHWYFRSIDIARDVFRWELSAGLVDPDKRLHAMTLEGEFPNRDLWLGEVCEDTPKKTENASIETERASKDTEGPDYPVKQEEHFSLPFGLFLVVSALGICLLIFESTRTIAWVLLISIWIYFLIGVASVVIRGMRERGRGPFS
jgi:hypothetical protein